MSNETFKLGLESLRGLAALGVAWTHGNMVFDLTSPVHYPVLGQIREALFLGLPAGASVVLFFALSGYVLGLALIRDNSYPKFVVRRLFRIFPALWLGVALTFIAEYLLASYLTKDDFHPHFQYSFLNGPTLADFFRNMVLAKVNIDLVIWSLIPEVIWSLALPAAAYIHFRTDLIGRLALLATITIAGHYSDQTYIQFAAAFYAGFFVPREILSPLLTRPILAMATALTGWAALCLGNHYGIAYTPAMRETCAIGAVLIVSGVAAAPIKILYAAPLRFLGRVSYSFYLLHQPTLFLLAVAIMYFDAKPDSLPGTMTLATASICIAIGLAWLSHRFVELPGIALGNRLISRWRSVRGRELAGVLSEKSADVAPQGQRIRLVGPEIGK
jgi:peptidoglycan/LPS O-acetylase OafA/YrhL